MSRSCATQRQMSERNDDLDQQVDELLCLSSVLSETEFQQVSPCSGKLIVHPICDPSMSVYALSPEHAALLQDFHNSITASDGADTTIRHSVCEQQHGNVGTTYIRQLLYSGFFFRRVRNTLNSFLVGCRTHAAMSATFLRSKSSSGFQRIIPVEAHPVSTFRVRG